MSTAESEPSVLVVEPFNDGSHKQLVDWLGCGAMPWWLRRWRTDGPLPGSASLGPNVVEAVTMPGKKWHWRMRASAIHLMRAIPRRCHAMLAYAMRAGAPADRRRRLAGRRTGPWS